MTSSGARRHHDAEDQSPAAAGRTTGGRAGRDVHDKPQSAGRRTPDHHSPELAALAHALGGVEPACAIAPDLWFTPEDASDAARICRRCPATDACRTYACANREQHGVWGGVTFERRKGGKS